MTCILVVLLTSMGMCIRWILPKSLAEIGGDTLGFLQWIFTLQRWLSHPHLGCTNRNLNGFRVSDPFPPMLRISNQRWKKICPKAHSENYSIEFEQILMRNPHQNLLCAHNLIQSSKYHLDNSLKYLEI